MKRNTIKPLPAMKMMGEHRGGRGFQGFRTGRFGPAGVGHRSVLRGRKMGSDDLQLLLLLLLDEHPSHGYELIKALEQRSAGFYTPSPGMVYPALTYLQELLYATVTADGTRKLYHLTPEGHDHLRQHRAAADAVMAQLEQFGHDMSGFSDSAPIQEPPEPAHAEHKFSISLSQGELIYLLCRSLRARRVVEFASSLGVSTLHFASAIRDNGGGLVIGSDIVPQKVAAARSNLKDAGLDSWVDLREGDARQTLRDVGGPVDFALIDGWPTGTEPTLARQVVQIIAPQLRSGGLLMNNHAQADYLAYVRDPANGLISISLPLKGGTELSLKR